MQTHPMPLPITVTKTDGNGDAAIVDLVHHVMWMRALHRAADWLAGAENFLHSPCGRKKQRNTNETACQNIQ